MITKQEFIRRYRDRFGSEEAEYLEDWMNLAESIRVRAVEDERLRLKKELSVKLVTQKDMAFIKAEFDSVRREMDIRFTEQDKRMRIYMGVIIVLLILLHPSVGALLTKVFAG